MDTPNTPHREELRFLAGPIALALFAAAWNAAMVRTGRPTVSMGVRRIASRRLGSVVAGGVIGGLLAHWFLDSGGGNGPR